MYNNKVYYNKLSTSDTSWYANLYEDVLYVSDLNFKEEKKIIETEVWNFVVHNNSIFYLKSGKLYKSDLEGKN